jgi:hypothetical protein
MTLNILQCMVWSPIEKCYEIQNVRSAEIRKYFCTYPHLKSEWGQDWSHDLHKRIFHYWYCSGCIVYIMYVYILCIYNTYICLALRNILIFFSLILLYISISEEGIYEIKLAQQVFDDCLLCALQVFNLLKSRIVSDIVHIGLAYWYIHYLICFSP